MCVTCVTVLHFKIKLVITPFLGQKNVTHNFFYVLHRVTLLCYKRFDVVVWRFQSSATVLSDSCSSLASANTPALNR
jgi:hypothetical protein